MNAVIVLGRVAGGLTADMQFSFSDFSDTLQGSLPPVWGANPDRNCHNHLGSSHFLSLVKEIFCPSGSIVKVRLFIMLPHQLEDLYIDYEAIHCLETF